MLVPKLVAIQKIWSTSFKLFPLGPLLWGSGTSGMQSGSLYLFNQHLVDAKAASVWRYLLTCLWNYSKCWSLWTGVEHFRFLELYCGISVHVQKNPRIIVLHKTSSLAPAPILLRSWKLQPFLESFRGGGPALGSYTGPRRAERCPSGPSHQLRSFGLAIWPSTSQPFAASFEVWWRQEDFVWLFYDYYYTAISFLEPCRSAPSPPPALLSKYRA